MADFLGAFFRGFVEVAEESAARLLGWRALIWLLLGVAAGTVVFFVVM